MTEGPAGTPRGGWDLRSALAGYVRMVHGSWLDAVRAAGGDPAVLPLGTAPFTVAVAAGQDLHLVATRDRLPPRAAHEQVVDERLDALSWEVRFLDATVVPGLAAAARPDGPAVTDVLGISGVLYHLRVRPDGALSAHHAIHVGSGLAHAHVTGRSS